MQELYRINALIAMLKLESAPFAKLFTETIRELAKPHRFAALSDWSIKLMDGYHSY